MKLLSYEDLIARGIPYSRVHLWRLSQQGKFPMPVKISTNRNAWVESEINQFIEDKILDRDGILPTAAKQSPTKKQIEAYGLYRTGMPFSAVAETLGIGEAAAKARVYNYMKAMRKMRKSA
ncbi:AlpA family phage regulatory protein [Parvularcula flava]|uniref:AlpA family phage regulatory protein n=1 Tax=Aquisalinus luteolus TaxID=1566827 RepID=A0A8J3A8M7_9PROT|nr:AlpA family phage regulatory protein [Aquisalinus luteolus]NHK29190.1 AlpA family phage regulatory protein [Aquisalinus luteolus]GGI00027.1 hypothetical protein GCM10011355_27350 [Aquisalinus luteolus]